jgi:hypothetical protein
VSDRIWAANTLVFGDCGSRTVIAKTVVDLFDTFTEAQNVVQELVNAAAQSSYIGRKAMEWSK